MKETQRMRQCLRGLTLAAALAVAWTAIPQASAQLSIPFKEAYLESFDLAEPSPNGEGQALPLYWKCDAMDACIAVGNYADANDMTKFLDGPNMGTGLPDGTYDLIAGEDLKGLERAVGFLGDKTVASANLYLHIQNDSGADQTGLVISYDIEKYRNGTNPAGYKIQLYYSIDGKDWTSAGPNFLTTFPADADNEGFLPSPGTTISVSNKVLPLDIPEGSNLYLAWHYAVNSLDNLENAQCLGIDNVSIITRSPLISGVDGPVRSSPVALDGYVYFGDGVGNMCCREIANPLNGWSMNTREEGGSATSVVLGRPSLNMIGDSLYLFFMTNDSYLFCVEAGTGAVVWSQGPYLENASQIDITPAVVTGKTLEETLIYLSLYATGDGVNTKNQGYVLSVLAKGGAKQYESEPLVTEDATDVKLSSPAAHPGGVYVSVVGGDFAGFRLNPADLSVHTGLAKGTNAGTPPYVYQYAGVMYPRVLITGQDGTLSAFNASNGEVEFEGVSLTEYPLTFPVAWGDVVYTAGKNGVIYYAKGSDGSDPGETKYVFYEAAPDQAIQGLTLDPSGINNNPTLLFGTDAGDYYKVPLFDPKSAVIVRQSETGAGAFGTTPTIDQKLEVSLIGSEDGKVYTFDRH